MFQNLLYRRSLLYYGGKMIHNCTYKHMRHVYLMFLSCRVHSDQLVLMASVVSKATQENLADKEQLAARDLGVPPGHEAKLAQQELWYVCKYVYIYVCMYLCIYISMYAVVKCNLLYQLFK